MADKLIVPCKGKTQLYHKYRARAKKKGLRWGLTREEFSSIVSSRCDYCGKRPGKRKIYGQGKIYDTLAVGVDRINSKKGYVSHNVVPCCWTCNLAKGILTKQQFLGMVNRVYKWKQGK